MLWAILVFVALAANRLMVRSRSAIMRAWFLAEASNISRRSARCCSYLEKLHA